MTITADDIRQKRFTASANGLNATEVRAFLEAIADAYAALERDNAHLRSTLTAAPSDLVGARDDSPIARTSLAAEDRAHGKNDAAPGEARAAVRLRRLMDDINELKRQRLQFESQLEALLTEHLKLLAATRSSASQIDVEAAFPAADQAGADNGDSAGSDS
ncbi:MAG: DivIVA domain-containing protein [Myxococcaceae bacterium]|nr:DivIVA domain-containing protein [Myxococcaceae bacterium]